MSESYSLDENEQESWDFILNGKTYDFRYPTTEETWKFKDFGTEDNFDLQGWLEYIYTFVTPRDKDTPSIKDALTSTNIKKFQGFQKMVMAKLGE